MILAVAVFWPVEGHGEPGDPRQLKACRSKIADLADAVYYGVPARASFSEQELNAHLAQVLAYNSHAHQARGLTVVIDGMRGDARDGRLSLFVRGRLVVVPLTVEYRLVTGGGAPVRVRSVRLGRLPLIQPFKALAAGHLKAMLGNLTPERQIFVHLDEAEIRDGTLTLAVNPRPGAGV